MLKRRSQDSDRLPPSGERVQRSVRNENGTIPASWLVAGALAMLLASMWAYWPTIVEMVSQWRNQPDYSHGFLVIPLAAFFLWSRRGKLRTIPLRPSWLGAGLLLIAAGIRGAASVYFLGPLDGWTIPIWVAGIVWLVFGWECLRWSLPAILFLWFMIPIPFSAETMLSVPLQRIATKLSTECLVTLGLPALSEGNTIWIGDNHLMIEEACSGLRILVGIYALAFAFVLFSTWAWWQKALALVAALPIAIAANVIRIVVTGLLYQYSTSNAARHFMHDFSGLLMIPLAAAMFWLLLVYLDRLFPEVEEISSFEAGGSHL
jgi:exosortase